MSGNSNRDTVSFSKRDGTNVSFQKRAPAQPNVSVSKKPGVSRPAKR